jgi:hypothetical protein
MIKLKSLLEDKLKDYDRLKFYHNYYKNLTPKGFTVKLDGDAIVIKIKND